MENVELCCKKIFDILYDKCSLQKITECAKDVMNVSVFFMLTSGEVVASILVKEELLRKIEEYFPIVEAKRERGQFTFLVSNLAGKEDRDVIIRICKEFAELSTLRIAVGNGFRDKNKQEANRQIVSKLLEECMRVYGRKKVYLLEDYYQKIIIEQIIYSVNVENYRLEELEKLKKEDQETGSNLYDTLYYYLMMKRNSTHTAAKMKIHRTTLFNRLVRINEILHLDEKSSVECKRLLLAMQLEKQDIDNNDMKSNF